MHGKTHLAIGAAVGMLASQATDWRGMAIAVAIGGGAALIPDWFQISVPGIDIKGAEGHRGFSHWLWTAMAAAYGAGLLYSPASGPFLVGYVSHLLLDVFSHGAPVLWPMKRIKLANVKTGGWLDKLVGGAGLVLLAAQIVVGLT